MNDADRWLAGRRRRRQERLTKLAFAGSALGAAGFAVTYVLGGQTQLLGACLAVAFGGLAVGLAVWGRRLLPIGGYVEPHEHGRARVPAFVPPDTPSLRRSVLRMLGLAAGALGVAALFPVRSLIAPGIADPARRLSETAWRTGIRLVDGEGRPLRAGEIDPKMFVTVFPEGAHAPDSAAFLVRIDPQRLTSPPRVAQVNGVAAYSLLCTHAGCPVALYQQEAARMVCPCHQSVFDLLSGARPVSGPAARSLPALPIGEDPDGYLVALGGLTGPPGPGYWSRP